MTQTSADQAQPLDLSLQEYLSLGYIYLVILGIISDVLYYNFLDIEILRYATILDILISPINTLMSDLKILGLFTLFIGGMYAIVFIISPKLKKDKPESKPQNKNDLTQKKAGSLVFLAIMIFSMFLGFGLGRGAKTRSQIKNGELKPSHTLLFKNGEQQVVRSLGTNSNYVFYVPEDTRDIVIAPISDNISQIIPIHKDEQEADDSLE